MDSYPLYHQGSPSAHFEKQLFRSNLKFKSIINTWHSAEFRTLIPHIGLEKVALIHFKYMCVCVCVCVYNIINSL